MTLEAIGQKLKATREAQGLSLRQVYERTKIPTNHLQSIDGGNSDDLPESVYVAGFIKRYAECVGLDGQVLADEYRSDDANGNGRPKARPVQQVYVTQQYLKHARIDRAPPSWKMWPFWLCGLISFMILVVWGSSHLYPPPAVTDPAILSLQHANMAATTTATGTATAVPPAAVPGALAPPPVNDGKVILSVKRHVWVEVKKLSTNENIFMGSLERGQTREFQDTQGIWVKAGEPGNLSVEFKGKIEPFGVPGTPAARTFDTSQAAVASTTTGIGIASSAASANSKSATIANSSKPKKPRKLADVTSSTTATGVPHRRRIEDGGYRSIGEAGSRSIEVPYRYSEGRLDAN